MDQLSRRLFFMYKKKHLCDWNDFLDIWQLHQLRSIYPASKNSLDALSSYVTLIYCFNDKLNLC